MSTKTVLTVFNFIKVKQKCGCWQEFRVLHCNEEQLKAVSESISNYFKDNTPKGEQCAEIIADVVNSIGVYCDSVFGNTQKIDMIYSIWA